MKLFEVNPKLSVNAAKMLIDFLDVICKEMKNFAAQEKLSADSKAAVMNCWTALRYLVLRVSVSIKLDRGIDSNFYDKAVARLEELDEGQLSLFWSFMFRGTESMLRQIRSSQYIAQESYPEVKKQLLQWHNFAKDQYFSLRNTYRSLRPKVSQNLSYLERGSHFVDSLSVTS